MCLAACERTSNIFFCGCWFIRLLSSLIFSICTMALLNGFEANPHHTLTHNDKKPYRMPKMCTIRLSVHSIRNAFNDMPPYFPYPAILKVIHRTPELWKSMNFGCSFYVRSGHLVTQNYVDTREKFNFGCLVLVRTIPPAPLHLPKFPSADIYNHFNWPP